MQPKYVFAVFDVDGTIADNSSKELFENERDYYRPDHVAQLPMFDEAKKLLERLCADSHVELLFLTYRARDLEDATKRWLRYHGIEASLMMRPGTSEDYHKVGERAFKAEALDEVMHDLRFKDSLAAGTLEVHVYDDMLNVLSAMKAVNKQQCIRYFHAILVQNAYEKADVRYEEVLRTADS